MLLIIFTALLVYFLYVFVYKPLFYWRDQGVPYARPVPLLGNTAKSTFMIESFCDTLKQMYNKFENKRSVAIQ